MRLIPHLIPIFRYLEWLYLISNGVMVTNHTPLTLCFYSIFFSLSLFFPQKQGVALRLSYVTTTLGAIAIARYWGMDFGLLLFSYLAKSYFLLQERLSILITLSFSIPWIVSGYLGGDIVGNSRVSTNEPIKFIIFSSLTYLACSSFTLMFCKMVVMEEKHYQKSVELWKEVELLATALERTRIARDLHDSLGHDLTGLDMQLSVAQKMRHHNLDQSFRAVDTAKTLAGQCIENVDNILKKMRHANFDLIKAVEALRSPLLNNQIEMIWEIDLPPLPVNKSYQIYCILKEAIINIQKHAHANQVKLLATTNAEQIVLKIWDNGMGFNMSNSYRGFGIQGMQERSQLLGGSFTIHSKPHQGTEIEVVLPL